LRHGPLRSALLAVLPEIAVAWLRLLRKEARKFTRPSAREIFGEIYATNQWGPDEFDSGAGSYGEPARIFAECVINFIKGRRVKIVVDLGCGNFAVGKRIAPQCERYIGVDVVPALIERNRVMFAAPNVEFVSLDITKDALPNGDLCLIRQVMQHLSNSEISGILRKVRKFPHVIIAEHYPEIEGTPNIDIEPGAHTRSGRNSAVYLDKPPFSVSHISLMAETKIDSPYLGSLRIFHLSWASA
jgi:SAM-dependent methyltransferase